MGNIGYIFGYGLIFVFCIGVMTGIGLMFVISKESK